MQEGLVILEGATEEARLFRAIGTLDFTTAASLAAAIDRVRDQGEQLPVVVDLTEVAFMDSAGLGALLQARLGARAAGRVLRIRSPQPAVERLMRVTGTHELLMGSLDA